MPARRPPLRIAAWSGPRNISTAMLRAWENRADTVVVDEPFYAAYLARTGLAHPGRAEVMASQELDWRRVAQGLVGPIPGGKAIYYQKHMAHHVFEDMHGPWLDALTHIFLIRDPARMLVSLDRVTPDPVLEDTGLPQQLRIFERVRAAGTMPIVMDAQDVLDAPAAILSALCERLGIAFTSRMLSWPAGPRDSDGVWAPHWYQKVLASTGFVRPAPADVKVPPRLEGALAECRGIYDRLYACRITRQ